MAEEVFPWLKFLPLAPEYRPTLTEFLDPISYIFKIEEEASKYGICKIVPPVSALPKKTIIANMNRSLSSTTPDSSPTFTTRLQQIGFCPRRHHQPVQRSVWQSGEYYTLPQFESKANKFEKNYLKKVTNSKKGLSALEIETLYWKAQIDKPIKVEYASDMSCSAFDQTVGGLKQGRSEIDDVMTVGESQWNMRSVARAKGSLLKFVQHEIPGITSPMVYMGMLFSWFAWHVEDHDFHSLNYLHMGGSKTWYGVPKDAAAAFEDVIRTDCYAGDISPIVTFATLGEKTTVMPPEILLKAGVPCCRLVQNAGEFVVTFPRAYHSGFSHGFNCAEAANIATPGWLRVAREAAIRRASIGFAPMVSHTQLLYDLALSSEGTCSVYEPRSSRLKDRLKVDVNGFVKRVFIDDIKKNNQGLDALGDGSSVKVLSRSVLKSLTSRGLCIQNVEPDMKFIFSCIACGSPCHVVAAIVQPTKTAAQSLNAMHYESSFYGKAPKSTSPIEKQKDISSLGLLAFAYGDSCDSEEEDNHASDHIISKSSNFVMVSNRAMGKFEYEMEVTHANTKRLLIGKGPMNSTCDRENSLKRHVFCLQHAREIKQRLQSVGGVHMLLVCHPDYPSIDSEAKEVAKELGITHEGIWTDLRYVNINEQDKAMIQCALDDEEVINVNQDWVAKLGLNIFYSARLGRSPYYRKQMPHNLVIYDAFGYNDTSNDAMMPPMQSGNKQKKNIVAGRWCGKVWMSNQVHPLMLVAQDDDDDDDDDDDEIAHALGSSKMNVKLERNMRKRKWTSKVELSSAGSPKKLVKKKSRKALTVIDKKPRQTVIISEDESDEGRTKLRRQITSSSTQAEINQHQRAHIDDRPLKCKWDGCQMTFKWPWDLIEHVRVHTMT